MRKQLRFLTDKQSNSTINGHVSPFELLWRYIAASDESNFPKCSWDSPEDIMDFVREIDSLSQLYTDSTPLGVVFSHRQASSLIKKYPFPQGQFKNVDPQKAAERKLLEAEGRCFETNLRLKRLPVLPSFLIRAKALIRKCLGELDPARIMQIMRQGEHGPGSSLSNRGKQVSAYYKFSTFPYTVTARAKPYAMAVISDDYHWMNSIYHTVELDRLPPVPLSDLQKQLIYFEHALKVVTSDEITFVPKTYATHRPIAIGASMNMYLQLAVKAELEKCLKRVGVDLTDQSKNQEFARLGSLYGSYDPGNKSQFSTIDLESASDTVSVELVKLLLPPEWYALLCDLRHDTGLLDGKLISYQKFSAMGNGYTFPLESLIFWAIAKATAQEIGIYHTQNDIAIYGDDIIVRYGIAPQVIQNLEFCGFVVNNEKTFLLGPFKESCGKDYMRGIPVRPYYLKRQVKTYEDCYHVCNSLASLAIDMPFRHSLSSIYDAVIAHVPLARRAYGPLVGGDDSHLRVPRWYARSAGFNPSRVGCSRSTLIHLGYLKSEDRGSQDLCIRTIKVPTHFRAKQLFQLVQKYRNNMDRGPFCHKLKAVDSRLVPGKTTRRETYCQVIRLTPVLCWDGNMPLRSKVSYMLPQLG